MTQGKGAFVFGVDLDGVCADFYGKMREVFASWRGISIGELTEEVTYGLPEWELLPGEYERVHRFAVTQRNLFREMDPIPGAAQSIRRLSNERVRIRIITHRLFISNFHQTAVLQTVKWLDEHAFPYSDLCFMADKQLVDADIYIEDTVGNIKSLEKHGKPVITFTNSTNGDMSPDPLLRVHSWSEAEAIVRDRYYQWCVDRGLPIPIGPGQAPPREVCAEQNQDRAS